MRDYRGLFLRFQGIICFRSVISFGIMGLAFHDLVEPFAETVYTRVPAKAVHTTRLVLAALFLPDCVLSLLCRTPITY